MTDTLCIPPTPDRLRAPAYSADALAQRERFLRSAAEAWGRAGDVTTASRLSAGADALADRFPEVSPRYAAKP